MLFNSYTYILLFLPIAVIGFYIARRFSTTWVATSWLILASLFFYGFWNPIYLVLLLASISFNYLVGRGLSSKEFSNTGKKVLLGAGISGNLLLLGYFKYADFFIENVNKLFGSELGILGVVLPLAISFFTFQQIAYLVDSYRGLVTEHSFQRYTLFVSFFPQLIAGPIVHHKEMMPQFKNTGIRPRIADNIAVGLFLISIGLFKKVVFADTLAIWSATGFDTDTTLSFFDAWTVALAYTFQLYFDFSGYTDMALGAARLFNIRLPLNFNSPYKAQNIQDFWRRWHMTLSRFLRDYLYIPLGGGKREIRTGINVLIVFLLGGLWHGAGWTFVVWGALHGLAVLTFVFWKKVGIALPRALAWVLTFLFVVIAWVFFRAESISSALGILKSMSGFSGLSFSYINPANSPITSLLELSPNVSFWLGLAELLLTFGLLVFIVFRLRNSQELAERFRATPLALLFTVALAVTALFFMNSISEFIYFQF